MNRAELLTASEEIIRNILRSNLPAAAPVYLFGSRSRGDGRWNSDFDFWIDAELPREKLIAIEEQLEESIVPFRVDLVCTPQLQGEFGRRVRQEAKRWDVRLSALKQAATSLAYLASVDVDALTALLDARLIDGLRNGLAQKFEYTFELCWKCIKDFIKQNEGIDEASPKKVIKAFHLAGYVNEDDYLTLLKATDDRNRLSHLYDDATFLAILTRIPEYARQIERVIAIIDNEAGQS